MPTDVNGNEINIGDIVERIKGDHESMYPGDKSKVVRYDHSNHVDLDGFPGWHSLNNLVKVFPEQPNNLTLIL